ncbi:uncharacterized protein V6R79_008422 [Siganus canaliculatus]
MATAMTGRGIAFIRNIPGALHSRLQLLAGRPLLPACFHTSTSLESKGWERKNLKVYPPQLPDEARRPAEVHHSRRQIKYSKDKMWYLAKMIRGLSIDEAVAQLEFNDKKGAKIMKEVLLEAQEMAVKNHNVEYKSNLYVAESYSSKAKYLKRIRYHGRGMFGIMDRVYCHYFVKLVEGSPPTVEKSTSFDQAKDRESVSESCVSAEMSAGVSSPVSLAALHPLTDHSSLLKTIGPELQSVFTESEHREAASSLLMFLQTCYLELHMQRKLHPDMTAAALISVHVHVHVAVSGDSLKLTDAKLTDAITDAKLTNVPIQTKHQTNIQT